MQEPSPRLLCRPQSSPGILFIYWLSWVFAAGLSLVVASRGCSLLPRAGFSLWWLLLLQRTVSRWEGSVVVEHGFNCPAACGILRYPDQSHVPCIGRWIPNHWATREAPLREILNKMLALITIAIPCVFVDFGDSRLILSITPSPLLTTLASWVQSLLHDTAGPVSFSGVPRHHPPHPVSCLPRREIPESDGQGEPVSGKMRSVALAT